MMSHFARTIALFAVVVSLGCGVAFAQSYPPAPPEAGAAPPPQGAAGQGVDAPPVTGFHIRGQIEDSQPYFIMLDAGGSNVPVRLHDGTVIEPTGAVLVAGMRVAIDGYWIRHGFSAPEFVANRVVLIAQPPPPPQQP
jgi:hypothetical protein